MDKTASGEEREGERDKGEVHRLHKAKKEKKRTNELLDGGWVCCTLNYTTFV